MALTLQIDSAGFHRALEGLGAITGADLKQVIRAEAGSILKACAGDTKVVTQDVADRNSRKALLRKYRLTGGKDGRDVSINVGLRGAIPGLIWFDHGPGADGARRFRLAGHIPPKASTVAWMNYHFKNADWNKILWAGVTFADNIARYLERGRRAIGLARQSWVQIADAVGIRLEAVPGGRISAQGIAKARAALASTGRPHVNGLAREEAAARAYILTLVNRLPYGAAINLDRILVKNVNARAKFYRENLARGVFNHLATVARAYPGIVLRAA